MNCTKFLFTVAAGLLALTPSLAHAQANALVNADDIGGGNNNGIIIDSNPDFTGGEFFAIRDQTETVFTAIGGGSGYTSMSNTNNVVINYDNGNSGTGTFTLESGSAAVLSANNAGDITMHNAMTTTGLATLNGATTVNNTFSIDSNGGTANGTTFVVNNTAATTSSSNGNSSVTVNNTGVTTAYSTNSVVVAATQSETIGGNTFDYGTTINGGALIEGDLGVNGSIYALNPTANTGINVGNNGLDITGSTNTTTLTADSDSTANNGRGQITLEEESASMLVYNSTTGNAHGMTVNQTQTTLSGGTTSTSLTLNDTGATFRNDDTGGPARVMGVADGINRYDAVNVGQLKGVAKTANAGIASVAAMANIPSPALDQRFALGLGYGNFENENAGAFGGSARVSDNVTFKGSFARSNDNNTFGAGVSFGW